jgi:ubiquinone/menaquinone biosynthesis C-methylase UbiE
MFSQASLTGHGFYELSSHLSLLDRFSGGEFVLDAASGPIANPEMVAYSWFYKYRVCVDISLTALQEAATKLEGKGFCCMADICQLPFRDGVFDAVESGYTIQHIAESRQSRAVAELYRVLMWQLAAGWSFGWQ